MSPPADADIRTALAAVVLFGVQPTDRALTGWAPGTDWVAVELAVLERAAAGGAEG